MAAIGTAVVLRSSNMKPADEWPLKTAPVQPTVLLAILTATANTLLRFAFSEAATIMWWTATFKGGSIAHLHRVWAQGVSLRAATFSGRHVNLLAVACIFTSAVVIDGPLLQRASTVEPYQDLVTMDLNTHLFSKDLPQFFSAYESPSTSFYTNSFAKIVQGFNSRSNITLPESSTCPGTCHATVVAPVLDIDCHDRTQGYNVTQQTIYNISGGPITNIGYVSFDDSNSGPGAFNISVFYKPEDSCVGLLHGATCTLRNGLGRYSITFDDSRIVQWNKTDTISITNYTAVETIGAGIPLPTTNGGFLIAANALFSGNVSMQWTMATPGMPNAPAEPVLDTALSGAFAVNYMNTPILGSVSEYVDQLNCNTTWSDPLPDILNGLQEMMLRSAVALSNSTTSQAVKASVTRTRTRYVSDYRYLAGALALMLANTFIIFPLFTGWRRFNHSVSLSPIETAKAFGAPALEEASSMNDVTGLLASVGEKRVRYGAVNVAKRVASADREEGNADSAKDVLIQRLMIADAGEVEKPQIGHLYI